MGIGTGVIVHMHGTDTMQFFYDNFSINIILASIMVFLMAAKIEPWLSKPKIQPVYKAFKLISPTTLGIYVIHPLFLGGFNLVFGFSAASPIPWFTIFLSATVTFIVSYIAVLIMMRIPLLKRTV